ncbi:MAG: hypothetical protein IJG38_12780 [Thermoguttaceae bacterium]|nr:hypothetical protein [Thermoguttaceae bacterium]
MRELLRKPKTLLDRERSSHYFFCGLRPRPGMVTGCAEGFQQRFGQGGGKPPHSPRTHRLSRSRYSPKTSLTNGSTESAQTLY